MVSATLTTDDVVKNRRVQLERWIDELFGGNQAAFGASTNDGMTQINQGEVSGLLKLKSFGEKRARSLELQAGMPRGYLDSTADPTDIMYNGKNMVQQKISPASAMPLSRQLVWPFKMVSYGRLSELKKALGPRMGNQAIRDMDHYLDALVSKYEREAQAKKSD